MNYQIEIQNYDNYPINMKFLEKAAIATLTLQSAPAKCEISVVITSNEAVAELNKTYRDIDSPTDVLSFPADTPIINDANINPYLGDLVIAYPYALNQAEQEGVQVEDNFMLLVIHGTLHLLGYDHDTEENRLEMWSIQEKILLHLNISPEIVPVLENR